LRDGVCTQLVMLRRRQIAFFLQWNLDDETEEDFRHAVCDVADVSKAYFVLKVRVS